MFIRTDNEIKSLMPTARWSKPEQLLGYLEEEERVALEPLLGTALYEWLCQEYERLRDEYVDITATTIRPTKKAKEDPGLAHADVTERLERISHGNVQPCCGVPMPEDYVDVPEKDMQTIRLLRICQQIEFYKMLSHKAGLLTVSFNEGGGMNVVTADGYDPADEKAKDRVVKDAFMSAGRAIDSLLLFLEADAKGDRLFTEKWSEADAFYLHKDLLFQTARVLNEYLDIKGERMAYVQLVRDIRFCQNTYLKPRIGGKLLKAVVAFANVAPSGNMERVSLNDDGEFRINAEPGARYRSAGQTREYTVGEDGTMHVETGHDGRYDRTGRLVQYSVDGEGTAYIRATEDEHVPADCDTAVYDELLDYLRTALAFYVESRRTTLTYTTLTSGSSQRSTSANYQKDEKLTRRDSMTDAQQAMATACAYVEENLDALGEAAVGTPIYNRVKEAEAQAQKDAENAEAAQRRRCCQQSQKSSRKLFTAFPATHRTPEYK